jgi:cyanate permease
MGIGTSVFFINAVTVIIRWFPPARRASSGLGLLNGLSIIFSSAMTPIYRSLVDQTGSFFIPSLISIGIAAVTFFVLLIYTKETYGSVIKD